jgi:hypothetical protein
VDIPTKFHEVWWKEFKKYLNPPIFKKFCYFFHQTSWNIVGIFTVVCGSFWRVDKIQNGGRCHGNQSAKIDFTFFAPWLPWQRPPFWFFSALQKLPHTTVDILTKFHEVWWKESKKKCNPPFLFLWQLRKVCIIDYDFFTSYTRINYTCF